ncbi:MAG: hypothetical protein JO196_12970, partial [Hyphomicrobiales bacterium]|nr:hypothetical protein [Hyphomicrobiales bacterium]
MITVAISFVPLAIWAYLLLGRGWFWLCRERDDTAEMSVTEAAMPPDGGWPRIA